MADSSTPANPTTPPPNGSSKSSPTPPKPQNPALRMLGLPNFKLRLPSRNWMIFWAITGSFFGTLIYDRREKRKAQQKWSNLVAHIAQEPLPVNQARRKLTIFLSAPPGDGLRSAREHFLEYVKPVLVSAALDYEVIEGRREGEIRVALANKIRTQRRLAGEGTPVPEGEEDVETHIQRLREQFGVIDEPGIKGDMIIGRHTWKEYIRGLHEGWLGPVDAPPKPEPETPPTESSDATSSNSGDNDGQSEKKKEDEKKKEPDKPKKPAPTPAYIFPSEYPSAQLPSSLPSELQPSSPIAFPHLLGFLNTPIRIYRFLTQRYLADSVGREVAALVLASSVRPYTELDQPPAAEGASSGSTHDDSDPSSSSPTSSTYYEQQYVLQQEEKEWHKSVHKSPQDPEIKEREWLDGVVIDPRIGSRMRRFALAPDEEARAQRIAEGIEWVKGEEKPPPVPMWKRLLKKLGFEKEDPRANVVIGNLDGE
ncbi:hypothetical protein VTO42DRAFT_4450 [Malbranchea cinnamomea]